MILFAPVFDCVAWFVWYWNVVDVECVSGVCCVFCAVLPPNRSTNSSILLTVGDNGMVNDWIVWATNWFSLLFDWTHLYEYERQLFEQQSKWFWH